MCSINKYLSSFPLNHLGPNPSFGVAQRTVGLHHHRLLSLGAWHKGETAPGRKDCNFRLQEGKTHPDARPWALTKGLEGVPENMYVNVNLLLRDTYGFLAAFSSLLKCSGQNSSGWEKCSGSSWSPFGENEMRSSFFRVMSVPGIL